ncbi:hypothetical protein BJ742DRAFT_830249 [Cladochytrium replicatum]|nr:hypothetical protein BJ742DRAFT_830249 [Cladochytrium replicatum]
MASCPSSTGSLCLSVLPSLNSEFTFEAFYGNVYSSPPTIPPQNNSFPQNNCVTSRLISTAGCSQVRASSFNINTNQKLNGDLLEGCFYLSNLSGWYCLDVLNPLVAPVRCSPLTEQPTSCAKGSGGNGDSKPPGAVNSPAGAATTGKSEGNGQGVGPGAAAQQGGPSLGAIVGGALGGVLGLIGIAVIVFIVIRRNRNRKPAKSADPRYSSPHQSRQSRGTPDTSRPAYNDERLYIPSPEFAHAQQPIPITTTTDLMGNAPSTLPRRQGSYYDEPSTDVGRRPTSHLQETPYGQLPPTDVGTDFGMYLPGQIPPPNVGSEIPIYGSEVGGGAIPPPILLGQNIFQSVQAESEQAVVDAYGSLLTRIHTFATRYVENHYARSTSDRQPGIVHLFSTAPTANVDAVKHLTATELYQNVFIAGLTVPEKEAAYAAFLVAGPPINTIPAPPVPGTQPGPPVPGTTYMPSRELMSTFEKLHMSGGGGSQEEIAERQRVIFRGIAEWLQSPGVLPILSSLAVSGTTVPEHLGPAVVPVLQELSTAIRRAVRGISRGLVLDDTQRFAENNSTSTSGSTGSSPATISPEERKVVESLVVQAMTVMFRVKAVDTLYKFLLPAKGDSVRSKYMDVVGGKLVESGQAIGGAIGDKVRGVVVCSVAPGLVKDSGDGKIIKYKAQVWADPKK